MPKKRILAYSVYYAPDVASTGQIYTELFESLSNEFDITVVCTVPSYMGKVPAEYGEKRIYREERNGVHVVRVPVREFSKEDKKSRVLSMGDFWLGARRVTRELGSGFDMVFTFSGPPILGGMLGVYGSKKTKAALVYGIQDFNPEQIMAVGYVGNALVHGMMMVLDKRSCKRSACVIVPGHDLRETLVKRFGGRSVPHCEVINNWADDESVVPLPKDDPRVVDFRRKHGMEGRFVVMYSGNLGLYYDLPNILKVIARFKDRDEVLFAFVGEGAVKAELETYARDNSLCNVVFLPYQPKGLLPVSLNAADVHLVTNARGIKGVSCPSKAYGIMAANVPMIGVLEPGSEVWRIVEESGCGVLARTGDYGEVESALRQAVDGRGTFVAAHSTGRTYLEAHLSRAGAVERYRGLFGEVCA